MSIVPIKKYTISPTKSAMIQYDCVDKIYDMVTIYHSAHK